MSVRDIFNYRIFDERLSLSGQPTERQISELAESGVDDIINLGPHDSKDALENEPETVKNAGMAYHYLPVDFANPTEEDYTLFKEVLSRLSGRRIHIHCIYNARVTAFMLRYIKETDGDVAAAESLMESIWKPGGAWADFIGHPQDIHLPNRYQGHDYE